MKENIVAEKEFRFAVRSYKLNQYLISTRQEHTFARQVLRSGTSIGANIEEALGTQTDKEFIAKPSIAYREARETSYWLRLIHEVELLENEHYKSIHTDCTELINLLSSILVTSKSKLSKCKTPSPLTLNS